MCDDPTRLHAGGYQAYAVLTMCRALYTMRHGTIVSKPVAARWAVRTLDKRWIGLIERALFWRDAGREAEVDETVEFIRYVWAKCGALGSTSGSSVAQ